MCRTERCDRPPKVRGLCRSCYNSLYRRGKLPLVRGRHACRDDEQELPEVECRTGAEVTPKRREDRLTALARSYAALHRNHGLATSGEAKVVWRKQIRAILEKAASLGADERDLKKLAPPRTVADKEAVRDLQDLLGIPTGKGNEGRYSAEHD